MIFQSPYMSYPYRYNRNYYHNSYLPNQYIRPYSLSRWAELYENNYRKK